MLNGSLCKLRHVQASELNNYIALLNDLPSRGEHYSSLFQAPEAIRRDFESNGFVTDEREVFAIEDKLGHLVGSIFHFKARTPICREIGYRLFDTELAGRGYITQATRMLCDYLFRAHQVNRLQLLMDTQHSASERIAQKAGFSYEGIMRQAFFINGHLRDSKVYSLLRCEWESQRGASNVT